jgi:two-component system, chemotaxis family, protein-glutamate methylesterase/glutaminase
MSDDLLRILIVDDSALYRQLIGNVLRDLPGITVVGTAKNGAEAWTMVQERQPDLLTLDVRMPDVDGIEVLRRLRQNRSPAAAIMLSSLTANGAQTTTDALLEGAFDFIHKPSGPDAGQNRSTLRDELAEKIAAYRASRPAGRSRRPPPAHEAPAERRLDHSNRGERESGPSRQTNVAALLIGTSTGGPAALGQLLPTLPGDFPVPILIVQHMPAGYTHSLAERLNQRSELEVVEACDGMPVEAGFAYIAPGGRQLKVQRVGGRVLVQIRDDPPENRCRPSIDYLFRAAAEVYAGKVVALVMTGMGRDGTEGCRSVKERGGLVIAQHPDGCTVYGIPKAVIDAELADQILPLNQLPAAVIRAVRAPRIASNP